MSQPLLSYPSFIKIYEFPDIPEIFPQAYNHQITLNPNLNNIHLSLNQSSEIKSQKEDNNSLKISPPLDTTSFHMMPEEKISEKKIKTSKRKSFLNSRLSSDIDFNSNKKETM